MNLGEYISQLIEQQGRTKVWVAEQSDINYKTFVDKLTRDTITGKELLKIAKILNIDLEQLKNQI
jgi:hypothetical protein